MMLSRTREAYPALSTMHIVGPGKQFTASNTASWGYNKWGGKPSLEPIQLEVGGSVFTVNPPSAWTKDTNYDWYRPTDLPGHAASIQSSIGPLDADIVTARYYPTQLTEFVTSESYQFMTDVVGSGFVKNQGKLAIVNPCSSAARSLSAGTDTLGSDSVVVTVTSAQSNNSSASYWNLSITISVTVVKYAKVALPRQLQLQLYSALDTSVDPVSHNNVAFSEAVANLEQATWEVLSTMAEAGKTISYLGSRLRSIAQIISRVRRLDKDLLRGISPDEVRQAWLEARYSIRPLVYDVENAIKAFSEDGRLSSFVRSSKMTDPIEQSNTVTVSMSSGGVSYSVSGEYYRTITGRAGIYATLRNSNSLFSSFGLANIATAAWEVVPWSFVVNWFVNTSALVAAFNPNPNYHISNGFVSVKTETFFNGSLTVSDGTSSKDVPVVATFKRYTRERRTQPSLINFNVNLDVPKLVDLLALAFRK